MLLVGNAAREYAIAEAFERSPREPQLFCIGELINPGIYKICTKTGGQFFRGNTKDPKFVADCAEKVKPDFVFVGPEEPNFHGIPDELERRGIACVGAKSAVAEIEMSKAVMRDIQWKNKLPGRLWYKKFRNFEEAAPYLKEYADSVALKPARQAGGKGVKVIEDFQVYLQEEKRELKYEHAQTIIQEHMKPYDDMEYKLLIEERVWGPEYTLQCFTDGKCVKPMPAVQDNKHAFEGDLGPETGGMGSISGSMNLRVSTGENRSILTEQEYQKSAEIVELMIKSIQDKTGERYHGVVAGQMMLTPVWGPTIIEMYSRFGDPEAVNVLPLLKTDLVKICEAIIDEKLGRMKIEFEDKATVVKAVPPEGYPDRRDLAKGHSIHVDEEGMKREGVGCYWASVDMVNGKLVTGGSRTVECLGIADSIPAASEIAERGVKHIKLLDGWKTFYRKDIGTSKSLDRRIELANLARDIYQYREKKGILGKRLIWIPKKGLMEAG
ncbi:MAG: phosphoribosylamine--glycine ligase [Hadesarchaea archaeon]|nr:phosphoribosylamine--glycine ligase [Hadesarchaea archaeon]